MWCVILRLPLMQSVVADFDFHWAVCAVYTQFPKTIKDGWRSKLANAVFAMGARTGKHDAIKAEFGAILTGLHSSQHVANYFRFQVRCGLRSCGGCMRIYVFLCCLCR